ncbi:hypothetical protein FB446DRAFT_782753 [Lentinula raphanica]|nr:hypothetical protein FB446DRAFT_782753 [Lentinula raphanica]
MRLNLAYLIFSMGLFSGVYTMPTKKVVSSGYDSDSSETSEGNDRPLKPSTPKSNSPDPYSMLPNALPPLRVKYRQPDDEHPVLEGVKGPEKPDEVVALFVGRRYGPHHHVSHRGIKFVESHPFHVLNDTFLWFQLFDDIKYDNTFQYTPCYPHAYFTVDWRRVLNNEVPAGRHWVEPETDPDKTSESWRQGDYPWPVFRLVD